MKDAVELDGVELWGYTSWGCIDLVSASTGEMKKRYGTPDNTSYESCYLTYQPMPVKFDNQHLVKLEQHSKWFANGAATKKMYLTVSHTEQGGMNFSFHYQTAHLNEHDMELMYYYMMRILFKGIAEPDMTLGEIMEQV